VAASTGACVEPEVVAALREIRGGNFDADPGREQVADAIEGLSLDGDAADARDALAAALRDSGAESIRIISAAQAFAAQVAVPEC
jgi:hypothetical protein